MLEFDPKTCTSTLGKGKAEEDLERIERAILQVLSPGVRITKRNLSEKVPGKTAVQRRALRRLFEASRVTRSGEGKKGDPYLFENARSLVPGVGREQGNENPKIGENARKDWSDSCSGSLTIWLRVGNGKNKNPGTTKRNQTTRWKRSRRS